LVVFLTADDDSASGFPLDDLWRWHQDLSFTQLPNPNDYLKDLFTRLPAAKITQIKEFTPAAWAKAKAKEQVVAQAT
jgi:hypothetical protein